LSANHAETTSKFWVIQSTLASVEAMAASVALKAVPKMLKLSS
jgi:hypothetical protein